MAQAIEGRTVSSHDTAPNQFLDERAAIVEWATPRGEPLHELGRIAVPTLIVNGSHDIMCPTINSYLMAQRIPDAQLIVYPDSGHGSLFQYPDTFVTHVTEFLDRTEQEPLP